MYAEIIKSDLKLSTIGLGLSKKKDQELLLSQLE